MTHTKQTKTSTPTDNRRFITIQDIVDDGFGCRQTVWRKLKSGELPHIKVGSSVLIERVDYERYIADLHRQAEASLKVAK